MGAVEREGPGFDLTKADVALHAGEVLGVEGLFAVYDADEDHAVGELEGGLDGVGEAGRLTLAFTDDEPVDHYLNGVLALLVEVELLGEVVDPAVDPDPDEAGLTGVFEDELVLTLAAGDHGGHDHDAGLGGDGLDGVDDLLDGLPGDQAAAVGAVGPAGAGVEESDVVVDLGDGADGGAGVVACALLVDGYGGAEALDVVDIGLLHAAEELSGVGGEGLDVAALALGVDGVEGEGALARSREAGDNHELVTGDGDVDVLEVMLAGAFYEDGLTRHGRQTP